MRAGLILLIASLVILLTTGSGCGKDCDQYGMHYVPGHFSPGTSSTQCYGTGKSKRCTTVHHSGHYTPGHSERYCMHYKS